MADASPDPKKLEAAAKSSADILKNTKLDNIEQAKRNKLLKALSDAMDDLDDSSRMFAGNVKDVSKIISGTIKPLNTWHETVKNTLESLKDMNKAVKELHLSKALNPKEAVAYNKELRKMAREQAKINTLMNKRKGIGKKGTFGDPLSKKTLEANSKKAMAMQDALDKKRANIKSRLMKAQAIGELKSKYTKPEGYKEAFKAISDAPDILSVAGNAAKGLVGILGKVYPILTGWPLAIFSGVKALYDMGLAADEFVKNANKAFATVRGPDIMTGNIKKQFKDFNDQIYKAGENIRVGLNVTQIRELMHAMAGAGLNITTLNKGLANYRDAIYVASKASKTLGVELPAVGSMMATMINNFRMNMDKVDQSFVQIAFDAKKSGLTTDAFWTTVQNANASLALYGVAIKSASKTMSAFTENAVGGADDAAAATQDMFNVFKSGTLSTQAAFLSFAQQGGANLRKMFGDQINDLKKDKGKLVEQINVLVKGNPAKGSPEEEQLVKLRKELYANQVKQNRFNAVMNSNTVDMTTEMGALAKEAPELVMDAIKGMIPVGKDISELTGQTLIVAQQAAETAGYSGKTVKMLVELASITKEKLLDIADRVEKGGKNALTPNEIEDLESTNRDIKNMIETGTKEQIAAMLRTPAAINAVTTKQFKVNEKSDDILASNAEDTFKAIVDQTLSYKEMIDIAKDEVQWRLNSLKALTAMDDGIFSIFKWLTRKTGELSEGQKRAQKALVDTGGFKLHGGKISQKDQTEGIKILSKNMFDLKNSLVARSAFSKALSGTDPAKDIKETLAGFDKSAERNPKAKAQILAQKKAFLDLSKKFRGDNQKDLLKENEDQTKTEEESLTVATTSLGNLIELNKTNAETLEVAKMQLESSPDFKKYVEQKGAEYAKTGNAEGLNRLEAFSPGVTAASLYPNLPSSVSSTGSGRYATGTKFASGAPSLVGEKGAEVMVPPRGAQIYPHGILPPQAALTGGGGTAGNKNITNHFNIYGVSPQAVANEINARLNKQLAA